MPILLNPNALIPYVFECDRKLPAEMQPRFMLCVGDIDTQDRIQRLFEGIRNADAEIDSSAFARTILSAMWRGVENLREDASKPASESNPLIEFDADPERNGEPSSFMLGLLRPTDRAELMNACLRALKLAPEEQDLSEQQSHESGERPLQNESEPTSPTANAVGSKG